MNELCKIDFSISPNDRCADIFKEGPDGENFKFSYEVVENGIFVNVSWKRKRTLFATVCFHGVDEPCSTPVGGSVTDAYEICFHLPNESDPTTFPKSTCEITLMTYIQHQTFPSLDEAKASKIFEESAKHFRQETHHYMLTQLSIDMCSLLQRGDTADVFLTNGKTRLRVHKAILSARSTVLQKRLLMDPQEILITVSDTVLENLAIFLYSGLVKLADDRGAVELYEVAEEHNIGCLRDVCAGFLSKNLRLENVFDVLVFADAHYDTALKRSALSFINKNYTDLEADGRAEAFYSKGYRRLIREISDFRGEIPHVKEFLTSLSAKSLLACN